MKGLAMPVLKLKLFSVAFVAVIAGVSVQAKAPMTTDHAISVVKVDMKKLRYPAGLSIAPLENYMDMQCRDFFDKDNKDEFVVHFRKGLKELDSNFCDKVKDIGFEDDMSQAERDFVGPGTFAKILEAHYQEFQYIRQLDHYQSLSCVQLVDEKSRDEFVHYFKNYADQLNPQLCDYVRPYGSEDSDESQAARESIGMGTFSKIVEDAFNEFYFTQRQ